MGVYTDIQAALDTRLNSLANKPDIVWPNTPYTPVEGTTFIQPHLLPLNSELFSLNTYRRYTGIYQIDVHTQLEKGPEALNNQLDAIAEHFANTLELNANGTDVLIQEMRRGPTMRDDEQKTRGVGYYKSSLEINFIVYK